MTETLRLGFGLRSADLYDREGLVRLDAAFIDFLHARDVELYDRLLAARASPEECSGKAHSDLLVALAPEIEDFVADLFGIVEPLRALANRQQTLAPLYTVKRLFVQRRAAKKYGALDAAGFDASALRREVERRIGGEFSELRFAQVVAAWMQAEAENADALDVAARYAAWAVHSPEGQELHRLGVLFKTPHKLDPLRLIPVESEVVNGMSMLKLPSQHCRARDGFALTDQGTDLTGALDEANYCIWCHHQGKDSCSQGLKEKSGAFKRSAFGAPLAGCPLDEKISEMNEVAVAGHMVGALAIVALDNPMCAATGHRICNDCMKACIFQKQQPVDIPQIETLILKEVLALPWGFEIYSLLTRWNPLNLRQPTPKASSGHAVLVVGLGPAGFTLAHHLMNEGHTVVAVDGLKIEPLRDDVSGVRADGTRVSFRPIRDAGELHEELDSRVMAGFGGVAEYGITVRWDKNFLKLVRLLLERRSEFKMFGGVRFGGAITIDSAFALGFDHIALCAGAGRPSIVSMKNGLASGVRQASDFLMALQLTGAAKSDSLANLQIRLPVVVIGGGLTAIDTATEALAYYPLQVEKFLSRYETLCAERGEAEIRDGWSAQEREVAAEFLRHARQIRAERAAAAREGRKPRLAELVTQWGGATIAYRRRLIDSPSYTLNHEEVGKALEEGIRFAERLTPEEVLLDEFGWARALRLSVTQEIPPPERGRSASEASRVGVIPMTTKEDPHPPAARELRSLGQSTSPLQGEVTQPARTILVAAGTQPNTVLAREETEHMTLDGKHFQAFDENGQRVTPERTTKPSAAHVLAHIRKDGRAISFFGDLHPSFAGNVVKAMASAKRGYPVVSRMLQQCAPSTQSPQELVARLDDELRPTVAAINRLTPTIVEIVVRAPMAARAFRPGQFYRLQNYETLSPSTDNTRLAKEGLALTGASVDRERGLLSTIVLEMGGSSDLCAQLSIGEPIVLMGPTGHPTDIPENETVLLVGGGLGNAVLFSIGQALRRNGSRVIYFAGYKRVIDRYKVGEIERAADAIVWCCDEPPGFRPDRVQDKAFVGNIVAALEAYGSGALDTQAIPLAEVDRVIAIGSDSMMAAVAQARQGMLARHLKPGHKAIASINSPMQCMMKEICAQCLQMHRDPATGVESVVFSCFNQDQELDHVDFDNLRARLSQNGVQEKLTRLWIDRSLRQLGLRQTAAE
jgi:NADPH-dependent glutamate synthase beta subunit-like oxidoreductase/NAD(P)H-flavin reductase